jgi:hypothetical protein
VVILLSKIFYKLLSNPISWVGTSSKLENWYKHKRRVELLGRVRGKWWYFWFAMSWWGESVVVFLV